MKQTIIKLAMILCVSLFLMSCHSKSYRYAMEDLDHIEKTIDRASPGTGAGIRQMLYDCNLRHRKYLDGDELGAYDDRVIDLAIKSHKLD